LDHSTEV